MPGNRCCIRKSITLKNWVTLQQNIPWLFLIYFRLWSYYLKNMFCAIIIPFHWLSQDMVNPFSGHKWFTESTLCYISIWQIKTFYYIKVQIHPTLFLGTKGNILIVYIISWLNSSPFTKLHYMLKIRKKEIKSLSNSTSIKRSLRVYSKLKHLVI